MTYRRDGHLLNQRRMNFHSRGSTTTVHELLVADDCAHNTTSEEEMQRSVDLFFAACKNFGLVIKPQKTVVMHQPPSNTATPHNASQISVNETQQQRWRTSGTWAAHTHTFNTKIDAEVARGISKSSKGFGRLQSTVWNRHGLQLSTELKMLNWHDRIPDTVVLERTEILSNYTALRHTQLRLSGYLVVMDDERLPRRHFYGDVATGSRRQGDQIRRYKDTLKSSMKRLQINPTNWEDLAHDRPTWRRAVMTCAAIYEANRIFATKVEREARKSQLRPVRNADAQPLPMSDVSDSCSNPSSDT
nr:unnamed protein product [Spirometra erinaceieuropaei]